MKRIRFKDYAGVRISGDFSMEDPSGRHISRAAWLTAMVESGGKYGTVINYDGTGMTAGLHQAIAVYPRELLHPDDDIANDQGPLWKLLDRCFSALPDVPATDDFKRALRKGLQTDGFDLEVKNGKLYDVKENHPVSGFTIRSIFSGDPMGKMPIRGRDRRRAEYWAGMFHTYFSDYRTFPIQNSWGEEKLIKRVERTPLRFASSPRWRKKSVVEVIKEYASPAVLDSVEISPVLDLAMCVWMSYTVNAPSIALKKLCSVIPVYKESGLFEFSAALIRSLGTSSWGRWSADEKNGRYQRTRRYAMRVWPKELFLDNSIMPKNL